MSIGAKQDDVYFPALPQEPSVLDYLVRGTRNAFGLESAPFDPTPDPSLGQWYLRRNANALGINGGTMQRNTDPNLLEYIIRKNNNLGQRQDVPQPDPTFVGPPNPLIDALKNY